MKKIITLARVKKILYPNTAVVISGSFEPFDEYYFRLLQWGAKQGRPFVVIVQKDDMVLKRRGFIPLSSTHRFRAEIISSLEFVDYVIIANRTAYEERSLEVIKPKIIVFQRDNINYRSTLAREVKRKHPEIYISQTPFGRDVVHTKTIKDLFFDKAVTPIAKILIERSALSRGRSSKISALIANDDEKVLLTAENDESEEHAEILLLKKAEEKGISIAGCVMYVLIPPCRMCAEALEKSPIKKVCYLVPYGDNSGSQYLLKKGVQVELLQEN